MNQSLENIILIALEGDHAEAGRLLEQWAMGNVRVSPVSESLLAIFETNPERLRLVGAL